MASKLEGTFIFKTLIDFAQKNEIPPMIVLLHALKHESTDLKTL